MILLLAACDKAGDCVKSTGEMTSKSYSGLTFHKILVNKGIGLVISQGPDSNVEVRTGVNLIDDISVTAVDGLLTLTDNTTCNWVRDYGQTIVYITAPDLTDIISKTEVDITSQGTLSFPNLHVTSLDEIDGFGGAGTCDFRLAVDNASLYVETNNVSRFFISGHTETLTLGFYEGDGIFHGEDLAADVAHVYHRGVNDITVHPINALDGDLFSLGNLYSVGRPPQVNVVQHYRGQLFFL